MWKALQDRLPTLEGLSKRNIHVESLTCKLCWEGTENSEHLLTSCYVASIVWDFVSQWCGIPNIYTFSVRDLVKVHKKAFNNKQKNKGVQAISCTAALVYLEI
ncbi:putative reverse transcriptase zinc-binding domain-containing protein [Helianthus anomalus]